MVEPRNEGRRQECFWRITLGLWIAVDDYVGQKREQLGRSIPASLEMKQIRCVVDQRRGCLAGPKDGVGNDILKKRDVGLDPANAEFPQRTVHSLQRNFESPPRSRDLD